jgi:hypothetical protein
MDDSTLDDDGGDRHVVDDDDDDVGNGDRNDDADAATVIAAGKGGVGIDDDDGGGGTIDSTMVATMDDDGAMHERLEGAECERGVKEEENLDRLTVVELRMRLRTACLSTSGRKTDLIDRLTRHSSSSFSSSSSSSSSSTEAAAAVEHGNALLGKQRQQGAFAIVEGGGIAIEYGDSTSMTSHALNGIMNADVPSSSANGNDANDIRDVFHDVEGNAVAGGASAAASESTRGARRKKYWKAREVRELINANDPRATSKAEEMIYTLEEMADRENEGGYLPGPFEYALLIDAYSKTGSDHDAIRRAEDVIDRLLVKANDRSSSSSSASGEDGSIDVSPTAASVLNAVMFTYANVGDVESARKACTILERMEYLKKFGKSTTTTIRPTMRSYSIAISAWAKCGSRTSAEMAEGILNRLMREYDADMNNDDAVLLRDDGEYAPNNYVFNSVIDAW